MTSAWPDCGTDAAYQRHRRRDEKPCTSCRQANARRKSHGDERPGRPAGRLMVDDPRPVRNGIPERPYAWRARSYRWAQRALAAAEAVHGIPEEGNAA